MSKKRKAVVRNLALARSEFAGVGTRAVKLSLNRLGKTSEYARALRIALEAEDQNVTAKRYFGGDIGGMTYAQVSYARKSENIERLIVIAREQGWKFGVQFSDVPSTSHIIYFEIPGVGQISWHYSPPRPLPDYDGQWDQEVNSTLPKLEAAIANLLGTEVRFKEAA